MGRAINKAVTIAEILKRKMPLHQCNNLSSVEMIDVFEPLEEGLDRVTSRRYGTLFRVYVYCGAMRCGTHKRRGPLFNGGDLEFCSCLPSQLHSFVFNGDIRFLSSSVSCMQITLSKTLEGIDVNDIGYQPPLPTEEMNPGDFHPMREAALIASS